jgi:hypothetical protein
MESKRVHLSKQHQKNLRANKDWWTEFGGIHPNFKIVHPTKQRSDVVTDAGTDNVTKNVVPETDFHENAETEDRQHSIFEIQGIPSPPYVVTDAVIDNVTKNVVPETDFHENAETEDRQHSIFEIQGITSPPSTGAPIVRSDTFRRIPISGVMREIQIYRGTGIVRMGVQDLREIEFEAGQRTVTVDDVITVVLHFNDNSKPIIIEDETYQIRFGAPTRELVIDGHSYECSFGAPLHVMLVDKKVHKFDIEGPPPQMVIGIKRLDLVMINNELLPLLDLQQQLAPNYQIIPAPGTNIQIEDKDKVTPVQLGKSESIKK